MADQNTKRPSELVRDAYRSFVRNHPQWDRKDPAQDVGRLGKVALFELVKRLGGDTDRIAGDAHMGTALASTFAKSSIPIPPAPVTLTPAPIKTEADEPMTVAAQVESLKSDLIEGGFAAVRTRLTDLIEKAQKPPVIIERIVERLVEAPERLAAGVHDLKPDHASTWGKLFGLKGPSAQNPITVWDHPDAPKSNAAYMFPEAETSLALSQMSRSEASRAKAGPAKNVLLYGPAGTGKSAFVREFAARTGRPFVCLPMNDGIEMDQLIGQTVLDGKAGTRWQDGLLLAAIRQPGMVVCLDEVGGMRPAVGVAMNGLLQDMVFYVPDTGERVAVARGVVFIATNNANLVDGGASKGYVGIVRQNRAFADRFGVSIELDYAPQAVEISLLLEYTGCTRRLAEILVDVAVLSRAKAKSDDIEQGIGFRRLLAWAECLTDGIEPEQAFRATVLNTARSADVETLRQLALIAVNPATIRAACANMAPIVQGRGAKDFPDDLVAMFNRTHKSGG